MKTNRLRAAILWFACTLVAPLLWIMQGLQALLGSPERSINMAVALDQCGNALFGGDPRMTISERTGMGVMAGKRWAKLAAPIIDMLFGAEHCDREAREWIENYKPYL